MRTMLLLLTACCALLVSVASAAAARSGSRPKPVPCAAKGSMTVAQNVQARVYVRSQRGDADQHVLVGCLLHSGQRVVLDSARTVSLRSGETLRRANTGTSVAALVQGPRGSFAYVSSGGAVVKSDATGETVVLDAGPAVDPGSLAVADARLYWLRADAPQSALLSP